MFTPDIPPELRTFHILDPDLRVPICGVRMRYAWSRGPMHATCPGCLCKYFGIDREALDQAPAPA